MNKSPLLLVAFCVCATVTLITSDVGLLQIAHAQVLNEVVIKDSAGFVRAQTVVDGKGNVEFTVVDDKGDSKDGAVLVLLNNATGETITGTTVSGIATFEGITPGIWTISTTNPGLVFTNVVITGVGATAVGGGITGTSLLALGGITAAGATGIAISNSTDNNNDGTVISPSS